MMIIHPVSALLHAGTVVVPVLLDASVKSAVLLMIAWMLTRLLVARSSASLRYGIWFIAIIALPAIPLLAMVLPAWHALPGLPVASPAKTDQPAIASKPQLQNKSRLPTFNQTADLPAGVLPTQTNQLHQPRASELDKSVQRLPSSKGTTAVIKPKMRLPEMADLWSWLFPAWLIGVGIVLGDSLVGAALLTRLRFRTEPMCDADLLGLADSLAERLNIRRNVKLLQSPGAMPMTWGIFRAVILLPTEANNWPTQRQRAVLLHELGHIRRGDCLAGWMVRFTCAVYWFHPMVWFAAARLVAEREGACDDLVLRFGESAPSYAEHLLLIASASTIRIPAGRGSVAMARRGRIDSRLRAILQEKISRRALTRRAAIVLIIILSLILVPLAMIKIAKPIKAQTPPAPAVKLPVQGERFTLRALNQAGDAIPDVSLFLVQNSPSFPVCQPDQPNASATAKTDNAGEAEVRFPDDVKTNIMAWAVGYAPVFIRGASLAKDRSYDIRFGEGQQITGNVNQADGSPIVGAKVRAVRKNFPVDYMEQYAVTGSTDQQGNFTLEHAAAGDYQVTAIVGQNSPPLSITPMNVTAEINEAPKPIQMASLAGAVFKGRLTDGEGVRVGKREVYVSVRLPVRSEQRVQTADDGGFAIYGIPASSKGEVFFGEYSDYITETQWPTIPISCQINLEHINFDNVSPGVYDGIVVHFLHPAKVTGTVTDELGKPFEGLDVIVHPWERVFTTDKHGRYTAKIPPNCDVTLEYNDANAGTQKIAVRLDESKSIEKNVTVTRKVFATPANELSGHVVGDDGKPVADATVVIGNYGILPAELIDNPKLKSKFTWDPTYEPARIQTNAQGNFRFNMLRAGKTDVWVTSEGNGSAWVRDLDSNSHDVEIRLSHPKIPPAFSGTVLNSDGQPAKDAQLYLSDSGYGPTEVVTTASTDTNGRFTLTSKFPQDSTPLLMHLVCRSRTGLCVWKCVPVFGGADVTLQFKPEASIVGRLTNKKSQPLADAKIRLYLGEDASMGEMFFTGKMTEAAPQCLTAKDGTFSLPGLPTGCSVSLTGKHPDYQPGTAWHVQNVQPGTTVKDIIAEDGITIQGTVRLASSRQPVAGATVSLIASDEALATATSDAQGQYQFKGLEQGWLSEKYEIVATVGTAPDLEGSTPCNTPLYPGDELKNVDITIDQSFASRQADWLKRRGTAAVSKYHVAIVDSLNPDSVHLNALTIYDSSIAPTAQYNGLDINDSWSCNITASPADHSIYIFNDSKAWLSKFSADGKLLWRQQKPNATTIVTDPYTGNLWALKTKETIYGDDGLVVFGPDGTQLHDWKINGAALAYSPHDKCFWICGQKLVKVSLDGKVLLESPVAFTWLARNLTVNPIDGSVWVAESAHPEIRSSRNRLLIVSSDGQMQHEIDLGDKDPGTIALDTPRNAAWMMIGDNLTKLSMDGKILGLYPVNGDLCVEPDTGCPWVAGKAGVIRMDPSGDPVSILRTTSTWKRICLIGQ